MAADNEDFANRNEEQFIHVLDKYGHRIVVLLTTETWSFEVTNGNVLLLKHWGQNRYAFKDTYWDSVFTGPAE